MTHLSVCAQFSKNTKSGIFVFSLSSRPSSLSFQFPLPRVGLSFTGDEPLPIAFWCWLGIFTPEDNLGCKFLPCKAFFQATSHPYGRSVLSWETVFHAVFFSKCMYALCSVFFLEDDNAYLRVNASKRAISMGEIFHVPLDPVRAFVCSYPIERIFLAVALWTGY